MRIERFFISSIFSILLFLFALPALAATEADIKFPIQELGNCGSKSQCLTYCDKSENIVACTDFALRNNLLPAKEAERARQFAKTGFKGPGGCNSRQSCEAFCNIGKNQTQCIEYAEKQGLISKEDAAIARRIPENVTKPGGCKDAETCRSYCDSPDHMEECLAFAEKYNIMPKDELREAREMLRRGITSGPGGCRSKKLCENYCSNPDHAEACFEFAVKAGFVKPEEAEMAKKFLKAGFRGGPGGCRSKDACENYCRTPEHADECIEFAVKMGFMQPEEAEQARKFMRSGFTSGPGGCRGMQECQAYCEDQNNMDECMDFAIKTGMMSPEEADRVRQGPRIPQGAQTPGNCHGDECREYCDNPDNTDECLDFAEKYELSPREDIERAREFRDHDDEFQTDEGLDDFDGGDASDNFEINHRPDNFENNDSASDFDDDNFDEFSRPQSKALPSSLIDELVSPQEVGAQTPSTLPDLTITKATINGAALNFLYHNRGEGDAQPEVSFWYEWIDGQGRRIGNRYWLDVVGMNGKSKREAYQLLDSTTLQWEHGKVKFGDLMHSSPPGAYHLKLTIDGPNAHEESNEQNNTVLLSVLRTDFTITDAKFRNEFLSFRHHNRGNIGYPEGKKISFWFEWVDALGARVGDLYWFDATPAGIGSPRFATLAEFDNKTTLYSAKGATPFITFFNSAPNGATHLKITIDGPNAYAEFNEGNNTTLLKKLTNLGSDLAIGSVVVKDRALHITARNIGVSDAPMIDVTLMWLGVKSPSIEPVTLDPISAGKEMTITISFDGLGNVNKMLHDPPKGAEQLRIFLDGNQKLVELNEGNNIAFLDRSELSAPKPVTAPPKVTPPAITPQVATPPETTPKPSLGKLDLNLSTKIVRKDPKTGANNVAYTGDSVQATLDAKNVGEAKATGVSLILNCPKGTSFKSTELNGKTAKRDRAGNIVVPDLAKGATHHLAVLCAIGDGAPAQSPLRFAASARMKGESKLFQSKTVQVIVWERAKAKPGEPKPEPPKVPLVQPPVPQPEPLQAFPKQDLTTDSDFGF